MPIYEFKCLNCEEHIEMLIMGSDDPAELACTKCGGRDLERIISSTNFAVGGGPSKTGAAMESRSCSSGSCTTWNLPGHS